MGLLHDQRHPVATLSARRREVLAPRLRGEEQFLEVLPGHPLQPSPLLDGKEHRGFPLRAWSRSVALRRESCRETRRTSTWRLGPAISYSWFTPAAIS